MSYQIFQILNATLGENISFLQWQAGLNYHWVILQFRLLFRSCIYVFAVLIFQVVATRACYNAIRQTLIYSFQIIEQCRYQSSNPSPFNLQIKRKILMYKEGKFQSGHQIITQACCQVFLSICFENPISLDLQDKLRETQTQAYSIILCHSVKIQLFNEIRHFQLGFNFKRAGTKFQQCQN